ncbi:hypothetical protein [Bacillus sp. P14.5]|uniref:hypothetical protein n=1 Tax=Bacillus sp. P14.5 TaxID=1983400 RepID=UPI000DEBB8EE|nr:hypothetical protein [Bacillus sp. P14.5]
MIFPWYLIRKNTISYSEFNPLRDPRLVDGIRLYLGKAQAFEKTRNEIVSALESEFSTSKDNKILNYKRKIFNNKKLI